MQIKRSDLLVLWEGLKAVKNLSGAACMNSDFTYAVAKTKRGLMEEYEIMREEEGLKPIKAPREYEAARQALCRKHAFLDEDGKPKTTVDPATGATYYPLKDQYAFEEELEALKEKHAEVLAEMKKEEEKQKVYLEREVEVRIHYVPQSAIPAEITVEQMDGILDMVAEPTE